MKYFKWALVIIATAILVILQSEVILNFNIADVHRSLRGCVQWGSTFDGVQTKNIIMDCVYNGYPICCNATVDSTLINVDAERLPNANMHHHSHVAGHSSSACTIKREYISSPYELRHYNLSVQISKIADEEVRRKAYMEFLFSKNEIEANHKWLERIRIRGASEFVPEATEDDNEYLSRFKMTKSCPHYTGSTGLNASAAVKPLTTATTVWYEWIEPLTIHARHPFSMGLCPDLKAMGYDMPALYKQHGLPTLDILQTDYVLVQSKEDLKRISGVKTGSISGGGHNAHAAAAAPPVKPMRSFFFDVGTSTFDSSLRWFTCAYFQRGLDFTRLFGWEKTLLEPENFWSKVPPRFRSIYHFFNAPAESGIENPNSPFHHMLRVATPYDFVSFKLDIDWSPIEIPLAFALANNEHNLATLVDEFFFEYHFRCEIMMYCGWGNQMPLEYEGVPLDRPHALQLFQKMRSQGIRAHIWV